MLNCEFERIFLKFIVVYYFRFIEFVMRDGVVFVRVFVIENVGYNSFVVFFLFFVMYWYVMCSSLCFYVCGYFFFG